MEILKKNQREMLEIKITVREIKTVFKGFITRLNRAQEKISELEDNKMQTEKGRKNKTHHRASKNCGTNSKGIIYQEE